MRRLEHALESVIFSSRWLLAPFFVGLIVAIGVLDDGRDSGVALHECGHVDFLLGRKSGLLTLFLPRRYYSLPPPMLVNRYCF